MTIVVSDFGALFTVLVWLFLNACCSHSHAAQTDDINCLRSIKASLEDPLNFLASWNFDNISQGFICGFTGIDCWHADENKVLNIRLANMGLKGEFPQAGISGCSSLTGLDLSGNNIHGNIPRNISKLIPYATTLDLSSNQLSGEIPVDLANCSYLNVLKLDHNHFTGQIPPQIGLLTRLDTFNVTNNRLSGPVPHFINSKIPAGSYANNAGLCGEPLPPCKS